MNGSIKIGSVFGITVRLHVLLLLMFVVLVLQGWSLFFLLMLSGCVLLHELGHSLVALAYGIRVVDITLWPLGGMARMREIPESARIEGLIAIAGPAVNFVLAGIGMLIQGASGWFVTINLVMGTFNLLPAFPMDGGRLLRAFLGRKGDWLAATELAVSFGRWLALLLCILGLVRFPEFLMLPLVALFIWWSGVQELAAVRARHARAEPPSPGPGFGPGEIEALERYRGSLSSWRSDER